MVHHWHKELLILHCTVLSLGQMAQLIMIILSLTALNHGIGSMYMYSQWCTHTNHCWPNLAHTCTSKTVLHVCLAWHWPTLIYALVSIYMYRCCSLPIVTCVYHTCKCLQFRKHFISKLHISIATIRIRIK